MLCCFRCRCPGPNLDSNATGMVAEAGDNESCCNGAGKAASSCNDVISSSGFRDERSSSSNCTRVPPVWLCVGLGARGLVYHAWLGQLVARGILECTEEHVPPELLGWWRHES